MFGVLAGGTTLAVCVYYASAHARFGSGSSGRFGPRFLIGELGVYLIWLLLLGAVFMALDLRNTDRRARIAEALDARPVSNIAMVAGRVLGLVAAIALPVLGTAAVLQILGFAARATDFWMGDPIEPVSLASFVLLDVLIGLFAWCATVLLLSAALRNRLAVLVAAGALLALQLWAISTVPVYLLPAVSVVSSTVGWASDIVVQFADLDRLLQRGAVLVLGIGICILAAASHPRGDGCRTRNVVLGVAIALAAIAGLGSVAVRGIETVEQRSDWLAVHREAVAREGNTRPDIERITGTVRIDPGDLLRIDIDLHIRIGNQVPDPLVFSFNPGMRVLELRLRNDAAYTHESGLLTVAAADHLSTGSTTVMSLRAEGIPDPDFGYLDSAVDWRMRPSTNLIKYLGTEASVFHRSYVALTPAVHWLPASGANVDREDPSRREPDFFDLDLVVEVPDGWLVAGPGRGPGDAAAPGRHRFRPNLAVQEAALFASDFERRAVQVRGIELELLISPQHLPNLDYYAEAGEAIEDFLAEWFADLDGMGLPYPEKTLSLVEVPLSLRTYRGGWRLDPVRAPGTLLLREEGLPTWRPGYYDRFRTDDDRGTRIARRLVLYFLNDWNGGNAFQGLAGNLLAATSPTGRGAVALDVVTRDLAHRVFDPTGPDGSLWFTAHAFDTDAHFGAPLWDAATGFASGTVAGLLRGRSLPEVWDDAGRIPLVDVDGWDAPHRGFSLLSLRGRAMESVIIGTAGVTQTGALLGKLRRRYAGQSFTMEDFLALVGETRNDVADILDATLHQAGLPGFLASPAEVVRLSDDDAGKPRYQVKVHVRNGEPVAGWLQLARYDMVWGEGDPVRVPGNSAVEIGRIYDTPPDQLWLIPYLSLNRWHIRLALADPEPPYSPGEEGFDGSRPSMWRPPSVDGIVVDDLDPGFGWRSAPARPSRWSLIDRYRDWPDTLDHGLPRYARQAGAWIRFDVASAWGKYRRTIAWAGPGDGDYHVSFSAELPPGRWRLDYHLPERRIPERWPGGVERTMYATVGSMAMTLVALESADRVSDTAETRIKEWTLDFDAALGETGWNKLGEFDLPGGEVRLEVSNRTNGHGVVADAIRWRRVE